MQLANSKVQNDYQTLKRMSVTAATGAKSERMQLLAALDSASAASSNTTASGRVDASPTERILTESLGEYEALAGAADQLSDQVIGLQSYVSGVCSR